MNPYSRLFQVPDLSTTGNGTASEAQRQATADARPQPKIVCGMTIVPADPSIDPKMAVAPPSDARYTIRSLPPPACR